jgi:hypothetical protein
MARSRIALLAIGIVVLISQTVPVAASPPVEVAPPRVLDCTGKYKGGLEPSAQDGAVRSVFGKIKVIAQQKRTIKET